MIKNVSWMSSFYVYAAAGTVWFFAWFLISAPSPDKCLLISDKEKKYIKESINLPEPIRVTYYVIRKFFENHSFNIFLIII